jgi:hypothetical protein
MAQPSGRTRLLPTCGVARRSQIKRRYTSSSRLACRQNPQPQNVELFPGQDTTADAVITHCFLGLRSGRLRGAVFHNARSLRCAQKPFAKHLEIGAEYLAAFAGASPLGDCACPPFPHRLRVWFVGECDHLRRPRSAFGPFRAHAPTRKAGRPAAGAQIITN